MVKEKKKGNGWEIFYGKKVRILVQGVDDNFPRPRDGTVVNVTDTHLFLVNDFNTSLPKAYLLSTIKRIEPRSEND